MSEYREATFAVSGSTKPYFEDGFVTLYLADALSLLPSLPPVDVVVTDPPYGETSLSWDVRVSGWLDRGGKVTAIISLGDEEVARGEAVCSPIDNFVKHEGRIKALGRAVGVLRTKEV